MIADHESLSAGFWRDRRVFVTGATGLVGSWLTRDLLRAGAHVVALVRSPDPQSELYRSGDYRELSIVQGRLEEYACLEQALTRYEIETVLHLGAQAIVGVAERAPLQTFESNIRGTYNLLEVCRVHSQLVRGVVVASSDKAYGHSDELPYTEELPLQGRRPYEVSKSCADLIAQSYHQSHGLPVAIARCGNIYGGGDLNWSRIVPHTIRACLLGQRPILRSDGTFVRDYIYVKDVCRAYMRLAERLDERHIQGEAFNFSPERPVTVTELVERIQRLMDARHLEPQIQDSARCEIHSQYLSAEKARRLLGWGPEFTLDSGLAETIAWYTRYFAAHEDRPLARPLVTGR